MSSTFSLWPFHILPQILPSDSLIIHSLPLIKYILFDVYIRPEKKYSVWTIPSFFHSPSTFFFFSCPKNTNVRDPSNYTQLSLTFFPSSSFLFPSISTSSKIGRERNNASPQNYWPLTLLSSFIHYLKISLSSSPVPFHYFLSLSFANPRFSLSIHYPSSSFSRFDGIILFSLPFISFFFSFFFPAHEHSLIHFETFPFSFHSFSYLLSLLHLLFFFSGLIFIFPWCSLYPVKNPGLVKLFNGCCLYC